MAAQRRAVVLVPYLTHVEPACDHGLRELERRGVEVRRFASTAAVDRTRCEMATQALGDGFDDLIWIDSDIVFDPEDVERLRGHDRPIIGGLYPKKGSPSFAAYFEPGTTTIKLGTAAAAAGAEAAFEVRYLGLGFLRTQREVYADIQATFSLPACNLRFGAPVVPYFLPMVIQDHARPSGYWYLGEDYAFCERARQAGHHIMVDASIRLGHVGSYRYGWEDAVQPIQRVDGMTLNLPATAQAGAEAASALLASASAPALAPDDATGETIYVDGGLHITPPR